MDKADCLIVGLGNPGRRYEHNFHNLGFLALDFFCARFGVRLKKIECKSITAGFNLRGNRVIIAKPQTFMNLSGEATRELIGKYNPERMIVVYDDIDVARTEIRIRKNGSAGTHNGMRNIIDCLGHGEFPRLRIGAGRPPEQIPLADYVLSDIPAQARQEFFDALTKVADALEAFGGGESLDNLMQKYNQSAQQG